MAFQGDSIFWVEVGKIVPNPYQPRREFDENKLKELSESIRMYGILQPLTVTRKEIQREDGTFFTEYELIAGERRLRASKLANVGQVPVIIRDGEESEQEKLELAIIENLQREDLNAVDRALAFEQLAKTFGLSHSKVAEKVGRSREYVSNSIRLLQLPDYMLSSLRQADISEGHARTLLMLNDRPEEQDTVYREILLKKLSVREVENIARKIATDKVRKKDWHGLDPEIVELEKEFTETLGTRVQIVKTEYGGKVTFDYFAQEDLAQILELLRKKEAEAEIGNSSAVAAAVSTLTAHTPLATEAAEESEVATVTGQPQPETNDTSTESASNEPAEPTESIAAAPEQDASIEQQPEQSPSEPAPAESHSNLDPTEGHHAQPTAEGSVPVTDAVQDEERSVTNPTEPEPVQPAPEAVSEPIPEPMTTSEITASVLPHAENPNKEQSEESIKPSETGAPEPAAVASKTEESAAADSDSQEAKSAQSSHESNSDNSSSEEVAANEEETKTDKPEVDESTLYSIRNFSV